MTSRITSGRVPDHRSGWAFLCRAVRRPHLFGSPAPSGRLLAAQLAGLLPDSGTPTVVELGAGTGALTERIHERLPAGSRLLAIELDEVLAARLAARLPGVDVRQGDAERLPALLAEAGIARAEAVVTSLPWTLLPGHRRDAVLDAIAAALTPEGMATAVLTRTALPNRARDLRRAFDARFTEVETMPVVWRNLPPAVLLVARRPRPAAVDRPDARAS
ncbi:methyltransferase domain-containing protein [Pseudonocardia kujensis]|uniref:class I SAM-dependent methyltransferase n=1 Tax=Pseudonocardia kujensis TaxID=1128675 RepID=UPI001E5E326B|nr:methyltransferase domain-containing protein [Pseudonocardia kujensis]MCE0765653.1 methyltransferase domain-containing protein [Pseudonocardia kujensis]